MRTNDRGAERVRIAVAGRELSARSGTLRRGEAGERTAERIARVRQRILEGAYDSAEMAARVARRILERGDL